MIEKIKVKIKKKDESVTTPIYKTLGSSGCDVCALSKVNLFPGQRILVGTGIYLEIPEGYECQIRPRSGLAFSKGVTVLNAPGSIDCFAEDSVISTVSGRKRVCDITINEAIFSFNEDLFEIEKDIISAIIDVGMKDVINFELENGQKLSITPGTIVYTDHGPKKAKDITKIDKIVCDLDI